MSDFSDFYIKNYFISKIICNFAARNNIVSVSYTQLEGTFGSLRYALGGDHPSQTTHQAVSSH